MARSSRGELFLVVTEDRCMPKGSWCPATDRSQVPWHRSSTALEPMARPGCPNTSRTKENKLEPSQQPSAKAVCQREIPKGWPGAKDVRTGN